MINGLPQRLREQREVIGLSQRQVADIIHMSPTNVSSYESGLRTPPVASMIALADLYHCSIDYLVGREYYNNYSVDLSMLTKNQRILLSQFLSEFQPKQFV